MKISRMHKKSFFLTLLGLNNENINLVPPQNYIIYIMWEKDYLQELIIYQEYKSYTTTILRYIHNVKNRIYEEADNIPRI